MPWQRPEIRIVDSDVACDVATVFCHVFANERLFAFGEAPGQPIYEVTDGITEFGQAKHRCILVAEPPAGRHDGVSVAFFAHATDSSNGNVSPVVQNGGDIIGAKMAEMVVVELSRRSLLQCGRLGGREGSVAGAVGLYDAVEVEEEEVAREDARVRSFWWLGKKKLENARKGVIYIRYYQV